MQRLARILPGAFLLGVIGLRAEPMYFPLQVGNQWIYRCSGNCPIEVLKREILRSAAFQPQNNVYYLMRESGTEVWLRFSEDSRLLARDPETGEDRPWYEFRSREGDDYQTSIHRCNPSAKIISKTVPYKGPIGEFSNALQVVYTNTCDFAGLMEEKLVPDLGMVQRIEEVGTVRYDLIYARVSGATISPQKGLAFGLTLDRAIYPFPEASASPAEMTARLTLVNTTRESFNLFFPAGQTQDLLIRDGQAKVVLQWSEGRTFAQVSSAAQFTAEANFVVVVTLMDKNGKALPEGRYTAEGWLATEPKEFAALLSFEIKRVPPDEAIP